MQPMPHRKHRLAAAVCAALGIGAALRIEPPPSQAAPPATYTMEQAAAAAVARSPGVQAARHQERAAEAQQTGAETAWMPRVSAEAYYRNTGPVPTLSIDTGLVPPGATAPLQIERDIGTLHHAGVGAGVGWRATDFGARDLAVDAAEQGVAATRADTRSTELRVATQVRRLCVSWLYFSTLHELMQAQIEVARAEVEDQQARIDAGLGTNVDLAAAAAREAALQSRWFEARDALRRTEAALRSLMGLPAHPPIAMQESLEDLAEAAFGRTGAGSDASTTHPELDALAHRGDALALRQASVERSWAPTVDLMARAAYQFPHTFVDTDVAGLVWAAGVTLSWAAFDGGIRDAKAAEWAASEASVQSAAEQTRENLMLQVSTASQQVDTARDRLVAVKVERESAALFWQAAKDAHAAGTATYLDVLRASEHLERADASLARARFDAAMAVVDWRDALGEGIEGPTANTANTAKPEATP